MYYNICNLTKVLKGAAMELKSLCEDKTMKRGSGYGKRPV